MPRNRQPTAILDAKGAFLINPQRARNAEPQGERPLGPAPKWMTEKQKKVWKDLAKQALPGVVFASDRMLFTMMVTLASKLYNNEDMTGVEMSMLITLGSKFAMTPADRSKVVVEQAPESKLNTFMQRRKDTQSTEKVQ